MDFFNCLLHNCADSFLFPKPSIMGDAMSACEYISLSQSTNYRALKGDIGCRVKGCS